jgi:hypothetical protein
MAETKAPSKMPDLNLSTGVGPVPSTMEGYQQLAESLKGEIDILKRELTEVRTTMLMRMVHAKAKRKKSSGKLQAMQGLVKKAGIDAKAHSTFDDHEASQKQRAAEIIARRDAAHERLMRRRVNVTNAKGKKKKNQTSVHPELMHERVGTDAVDVDDFVVTFDHGPLGLHLEEIHDCSYAAFVAETQEGSQAAASGLKIGDILIKIKNQSMEDIPFDDTIQTLMATGRPLVLMFRRRLKVYCDHAEGIDGAGHMHGGITSFDAGSGDLGFSLEEMSNATLNGVRYDLCVTDVNKRGQAYERGLRSLDVLVGINGDSVGGLGFEETRHLLVKSPRPMSLHFLRFSEGPDTIEMGTDYLHEEVLFVLQYVDLATERKGSKKKDLAKMSKKDEAKLKTLQTKRHTLQTIKGALVHLLDEGALHSDRETCAELLGKIRTAIQELDECQNAVDMIGQGKKKKKKKG